MSEIAGKVSDLKVTELKEHLAARKLDQKGKKAELVSRLEEAIKKEKEQQKPVPAKTANAPTKATTPATTTTPKPVTTTSVEKAKVNEKSQSEQKSTTTTPASTANSITTSKSSTTPAVNTTAGTTVVSDSSENGHADDKPLTEEEKKKIRAERFNVPLSSPTISAHNGVPSADDEKKKSRAQRFGIPENSAPKPLGGDEKQKRAKRFGLPVKDPNAPLDDQKKQNRANRFGKNMKWTKNDASNSPAAGAAKAKVETTNITWKPEDEEKKRKRAERFGVQEENAKKPKVEVAI